MTSSSTQIDGHPRVKIENSSAIDLGPVGVLDFLNQTSGLQGGLSQGALETLAQKMAQDDSYSIDSDTLRRMSLRNIFSSASGPKATMEQASALGLIQLLSPELDHLRFAAGEQFWERALTEASDVSSVLLTDNSTQEERDEAFIRAGAKFASVLSESPSLNEDDSSLVQIELLDPLLPADSIGRAAMIDLILQEVRNYGREEDTDFSTPKTLEDFDFRGSPMEFFAENAPTESQLNTYIALIEARERELVEAAKQQSNEKGPQTEGTEASATNRRFRR